MKGMKGEGKITEHLKGRYGKASLQVNATMTAPTKGEGPDSMKWEREHLKQLEAEVKAIEKRLADWDPEEAARLAERSLRTELAVKKARLEEYRARIAGRDHSGTAAPVGY